jgi:hypothetical protein
MTLARMSPTADDLADAVASFRERVDGEVQLDVRERWLSDRV